MNQFSKNLKDYRKLRKLTQTELAEKLGLTKQSVINYEKGMTFPTGNRLNDLIKVLDVTPEQLLGSEMLQLPEEKTMLNLCREKSKFIAWYHHVTEEKLDYDIVEEQLHGYLEQLTKNLSNDEMCKIICAIYDNKLYNAQSNYIGEMTSNLLDAPYQSSDDDMPDVEMPTSYFK